MKTQITYFIILIVFLYSCEKNNDAIIVEEIPSLELVSSNPPFTVTPEVSFYSDIEYGEFERNKFDFFAPVTNNKTPLVIYIHGGGFTGGDKTAIYSETDFISFIDFFVSQNIAVATINYRFIEDNDSEGVLKSLNDSKRALQFMKYFAQDLNINKNKILLIGGSAGAGTSLWLSLSDDMALVNSTDMVLKESTRVQGAVALSTQSSYDVAEWHNSTFFEYQNAGMDFDLLLNLVGEQTFLNFFGIDDISDLNTPIVQNKRTRLDMLGLLSSDDPEIFVSNTDVPYTFPTNNGDVLHHPLHAKAILDKATEENVICKAYIPQMGIDNTNGENMPEFILRILSN